MANDMIRNRIYFQDFDQVRNRKKESVNRARRFLTGDTIIIPLGQLSPVFLCFLSFSNPEATGTDQEHDPTAWRYYRTSREQPSR